MKKLLLASAAVASIGAASASTFPTNTTPPWKSYMATGNAADIVSSTTVAAAIGGKVDATNGQSAGQTLQQAIVSANALHVPGLSPFITCPINACLTSAEVGGNVYAPSEVQYVTQKDANEEIGLNVSVLDNTGADSNVPGSEISPGAKMAGYFGIMQTSNGGTAWGLNTVVTRNAVPYEPAGPNGEPGTGTDGTPGAVAASIGTIGYEADLNNRDQSGASGTPFIVNLYVAGSSLYTSTAGIFYAGNNGKPGVPEYQYGLQFSGPSTNVGSSVGGVAIEDDSSAATSYHTIGSHSTASFYDESTGPHSVWVTGTHTDQDIEINTTSPRQIELDGASTQQSILDNTTGPHGYQVMGTHTGADIEVATGSPVGIEMQGTRTSEDQNINTETPIGTLYQGTHSTADIDLLSSSPTAITAGGTYSGSVIDTQSATASYVLKAKPGQEVCLNGSGSCIYYSSSDAKIYFTNAAGTKIASLSDTGNLIVSGTVTQSGTP